MKMTDLDSEDQATISSERVKQKNKSLLRVMSSFLLSTLTLTTLFIGFSISIYLVVLLLIFLFGAPNNNSFNKNFIDGIKIVSSVGIALTYTLTLIFSLFTYIRDFISIVKGDNTEVK